MEVGAVKQAFNNEVILLKKNLNQARIQIIHKLTRKSKTLTEKKAPEKLKEKLKRKAESAVNEVLMLKKIKPKDLAKFIVTHTDDLNKYLNKPQVDQEKACARLLLHKSLQEKYKFIRSRFSNIPIKDLFMSRQERRKLKKEAKEKQKNKKKGKVDKTDNSNNHIVNDIELDNNEDARNDVSSDENVPSDEEMGSDDESEFFDNENEETKDSESELENNTVVDNENGQSDKESSDDDANETESSGRFVKLNPTINYNDPAPKCKPVDEPTDKNNIKVTQQLKEMKRPEKKLKDSKNKNLKEKLLSRNFKKASEDVHIAENKVVDPFFITSTGENYMSVAEPRQPDEVKDIHKMGNRKQRRAALFGRKVEVNSRFSGKNKNTNISNNSRTNNNRSSFNGQNDFANQNESGSSKDKNNRFPKSKDVGNYRNDHIEAKNEKLHPSWEAKKKQSSILPFEGKKIVFDEE